VLAGGNTDAPQGLPYNTTFRYTAQGRADRMYRKRHLVPFGEFVPFRDALSFIKALEQIPYDFAPGKQAVTYEVAGHRLGILICFESAFAPMARAYARDGVEAIVVSTNNRSFERSANAAQHVALGQMRAAETGRPVIHAGISGISALIDARGRVQRRTSVFDPTVLTGTVTTTTGRTPYVVLGDWILGVAVGLAVVAWVLGYRRRNLGPEPGEGEP
jgi:apolipoprotein N-acyltransferase